jgi:hypothetical protein
VAVAVVNLATARARVTRAHRDYRVALVELDWAAGTLSPTTAEISTAVRRAA